MPTAKGVRHEYILRNGDRIGVFEEGQCNSHLRFRAGLSHIA